MKERVYLGMSGGVDSSVSAALLQEKYDVTGAYIKGWYPDFLTCSWREDRRDAMRVAAKLGLPFTTIDAEEAYKRGVVEYLLAEYGAGNTPNPDIMCNREVKFGEFFRQALKAGADSIATGHYARTTQHEGVSTLRTAADHSKDQTYFLWSLSSDILERTIFPVGDFEKSEVRAIADKLHLATAHKKDSQGVCFLGTISMKDFLRAYCETTPGAVLNTDGEVIGEHDGAILYTLGERKGFRVPAQSAEAKSLYVVDKDLVANTITVSDEIAATQAERSEFSLRETNFTLEPNEFPNLTVRVRYRGELVPARVISTERNEVEVVTEKPVVAVPGQSAVFYAGELCIGGGIITV